MLDRGQQPRGFIAGRLDDAAVALGQGGLHKRIPRCVIAGLRGLFQNNAVAFRVHGDEAKAAGTRVVLRHGDLFFGHVLGQARRLVVTAVDHGVLDLRVDPLLGAIGGGDKPVASGHVEEEAYHADAARPDLDTGCMKGNDESD